MFVVMLNGTAVAWFARYAYARECATRLNRMPGGTRHPATIKYQRTA